MFLITIILLKYNYCREALVWIVLLNKMSPIVRPPLIFLQVLPAGSSSLIPADNKYYSLVKRNDVQKKKKQLKYILNFTNH